MQDCPNLCGDGDLPDGELADSPMHISNLNVKSTPTIPLSHPDALDAGERKEDMMKLSDQLRKTTHQSRLGSQASLDATFRPSRRL